MADTRSFPTRGVLAVPVPGFLAITITFFIALFPGSVLGLECASIFAIFTSRARNMTFSTYHSLVTQPTGLDEAARMFRLTKWERFWHLDVPGVSASGSDRREDRDEPQALPLRSARRPGARQGARRRTGLRHSELC